LPSPTLAPPGAALLDFPLLLLESLPQPAATSAMLTRSKDASELRETLRMHCPFVRL
jgi:hypothetical protein